MTKARDIADFKFENIVDTGTEGLTLPKGTTAQRGSTEGQIRYNTETDLAEYYVSLFGIMFTMRNRFGNLDCSSTKFKCFCISINNLLS